MRKYGLSSFLGLLLTLAAGHAAAASSFEACLDDLRSQARQAGVRPEVLMPAFAAIRQRPDVIRTDRGGQSEFVSSFWDWNSCSCSDFVAVETTTPCPLRIAGTR